MSPSFRQQLQRGRGVYPDINAARNLAPHPGFQWKFLRQSKQNVFNTDLGHFTKLKLQVVILISDISTSESLLD